MAGLKSRPNPWVIAAHPFIAVGILDGCKPMVTKPFFWEQQDSDVHAAAELKSLQPKGSFVHSHGRMR